MYNAGLYAFHRPQKLDSIRRLQFLRESTGTSGNVAGHRWIGQDERGLI